MRRLLSIAFVLAAGIAAMVLTAAKADDEKVLRTFEVEFDNAFGLVDGGDLKIGGVKAGQTKGFRLTKTQPYRTIVKAEITEPGFENLRTDASCDVRQQSLIGEYFIDCELGDEQARLPEGGLIPVKRTSSTIPPDLINDVMRRPYRERFRLILSELGTGLAGRPDDLNEVIRRAHPGLRELNETLAILRGQNKEISDFIRDADTVSNEIEPVKEDLVRWIRESEDTASIQATRSDQLGRYYERLPDFLREAKPTLDQLQRTADRQIPTLRSLQRAAPDLERFLTAAQPFARETRRAIPVLGQTAEAGSRAIVESDDEITQLRKVGGLAPRLAKPLRQFLQAIDDRRRSTDNDPAARAIAPPAPDKTAFKEGQGFTGMEGLWNYFYFQTLAINSFDELGHLLRIVSIAGGPCAPYSASPTAAEIKECNSWLGPYQPGVTGADPGDPAEVPVGAPGPGGPASVGKRPAVAPRGAGAPEAPPVPGQRDLSRPQITPPVDLNGLRDSLPKVPLDAQSGEAPADPTQVLDFLLGP